MQKNSNNLDEIITEVKKEKKQPTRKKSLAEEFNDCVEDLNTIKYKKQGSNEKFEKLYEKLENDTFSKKDLQENREFNLK